MLLSSIRCKWLITGLHVTSRSVQVADDVVGHPTASLLLFTYIYDSLHPIVRWLKCAELRGNLFCLASYPFVSNLTFKTKRIQVADNVVGHPTASLLLFTYSSLNYIPILRCFSKLKLYFAVIPCHCWLFAQTRPNICTSVFFVPCMYCMYLHCIAAIIIQK
jgi:hypothetical protein